MSMKLTVAIDGAYVSVRQTPTHVTKMLLVSAEGVELNEYSGEDAKRVIYSYLCWVGGTLNGSYSSFAEMEEAAAPVKAHVDRIKALLKTGKVFHVGYV